MKRKTFRLVVAGCALGSFIALACEGKSSHARSADGQASIPATQAVSATESSYTDPNSGVSVTYPNTWVAKPSDDYELLIVPKGASDMTRSISLDVPDLPAHIPGLIPLGSVRKGYVDDLKKKHPGLKIVEDSSAKIEKGKADLVRCTWSEKDGKAASETALVMVHGDGVYIVRADSDEPHYQDTRKVFDDVTASLKWTKK